MERVSISLEEESFFRALTTVEGETERLAAVFLPIIVKEVSLAKMAKITESSEKDRLLKVVFTRSALFEAESAEKIIEERAKQWLSSSFLPANIRVKSVFFSTLM